MSKALLSTILLLYMSMAGPVAVSTAKTGDTLYTQGTAVNVRSGPGKDHDVVVKLARGHHLVEFARRGGWVHVGVSQSGGMDGWIHESLVDTVLRGSPAAKPAKSNPNFEAFRKDMAKLNEQARRTASFPFITKIEDMGDSTVRLTAHDGWLEAPRAEREKNLNGILEL